MLVYTNFPVCVLSLLLEQGCAADILYSQEMVVHRIAFAMSATIGMIYLFRFVIVIFCSYSIKHFLLSKFLVIKYKTTGM